MRLFNELLLPLIVVGINVALGAYTGLALFHVMAAVILVLYLAKFLRR